MLRKRVLWDPMPNDLYLSKEVAFFLLGLAF